MAAMEDSDRTDQDGIVDAVGDMIETYRNLVNVRIIQGTAMGASISLLGILLLVVCVFVLLFAGLGAAWWIGDVMDNIKAGFFIVCGFYFLIFVIALLTSRSVLLPWLRNLIVRKIYEEI